MQSLLLMINGMLLGIVIYFAKSLVSQITKTSNALTGLDKSVSLLSQKMDNHAVQFKFLYKSHDTFDEELKELRFMLSTLSNEISNLKEKVNKL